MIKKKKIGTSLEVQWLRLCTPNTGSPGSIPGQVTRFHMTQAWPKKRKEKKRKNKNNCTRRLLTKGTAQDPLTVRTKKALGQKPKL